MFEYPELFKEADTLSRKFQKYYYTRLGVELVLTTIAAILGFVAEYSPFCSTLQLGALIALVLVLVTRFVVDFDQDWYKFRSLAESIKTLSWKYVMKSEPFTLEDSDSMFRDRVWKMLQEDKSCIKQYGSRFAQVSYISESMITARKQKDSDRIELYKTYRIQDQRDWYCSKSEKAKRAGKISSTIIFIVILIAVAFCFIKLFFHVGNPLPIDGLVVIAASLIAWSESKRYSSLANTYSFTASEINYLSESFEDDIERAGLSTAVADAENAFSREHSQWLSRKDS